MIKNIIKNIENNEIKSKDLEYLFSLKNLEEINILYQYSKQIQANNFNDTNYETNVYYPTIYQIEDNCPTCGYRTKESRRKYTEEYICKLIAYKLSDLNEYTFNGINCYNKDITGIRELLIILNYLEKINIDINVRVSNHNHLKYLQKYNLKSIIYSPMNNRKFNTENDKEEEQLIEYIKNTMNLEVVYELMINNGESHHDILNYILKIRKLNIDTVEIKGFDPFIDCAKEYNPQYSKEYILKIICILRIYLPNINLKIQYATNENQYLKEFCELGINTITGIYTEKLDSQLKNIDNIPDKFLKN